MSTAITILGNTGRDVELRYTPTGTAVANFSVASNTVRKRGNEQQKTTDWFNVSAFGKQAETLAKYLTKGSQVLIRGKLTFSPWLSREGEPRVNADVLLQDFEFAGSAARNGSETAEYADSDYENDESSASMAASETTVDEEEKAEMLGALNEPAIGDEVFAGQF